ncbi:MAG: hypothetical protein WDM81_10895 [Rhizomicrobium sp.]
MAVQRDLPHEPKLFALVHELKHHYRDREALGARVIACGDYNQNELIEIGAEVSSAEFIYPESEFIADVQSLDFNVWGRRQRHSLQAECLQGKGELHLHLQATGIYQLDFAGATGWALSFRSAKRNYMECRSISVCVGNKPTEQLSSSDAFSAFSIWFFARN